MDPFLPPDDRDFANPFAPPRSTSVHVPIGPLAAARDHGALAVVGIFAAYCASIATNLWLLSGEMRAYLKIARNQPVTFDEVFQGGRYVLTMIHVWIAFIIVLAVSVVLGIGVSVAGLRVIGDQAGGILFLATGVVMATGSVFPPAKKAELIWEDEL